MSEPAQLAKNAREQLATALNALQSNAGVPPELENLAEPIAQAMGILHRIERTSGQNLDGSDVALAHVRTALNELQALAVDHPVIDLVMEAVATSLSKVHALARVASGASRAARQPAPMPQPVAAPMPQPMPQPMEAPMPQPMPQPVAAPMPQPMAAPMPQLMAPMPQPMAPMPQPQQPVAAPMPQPAPAAPVNAVAGPVPEPADTFVPPSAPRGQSSSPTIEVELGTHSASNFYKGLGGNDIVENGGIFVATYKIPKIGAPVRLRVHLPGGYEFQAAAQVQWIREPGGFGDSTEPGFGARFTHISPEGRQLVVRYARNREPLFYDDL